MNVQITAYIAGRVIGRMPDIAPAAGDLEDLVQTVIDELAECGERFTFERVDGQPINEDWDEATAYHVESLDAWDEFDMAGQEPAEYVTRRWVLVAEQTRTLPATEPAQTEQLPL